MRKPVIGGLVLAVVVACGDASSPPDNVAAAPNDAGGGSQADVSGPSPDASSSDDGGDASAPDASSFTSVRIMAANTTSGNAQSYDPGEGIRMFQAIKPDIALVQEMNYKTNTTADIHAFVTTAFGAEYQYFRESNAQIPNGVVSRYPIVTSGAWADPIVSNRSFAYAKIDVPGGHPLWAVSVHFVTSNASTRNTECTSLDARLAANVAAGEYVIVGGDFNTDARTEPCLTTLSATLSTAAPYPADQNGNTNTNASRSKPYDWLLADPVLTGQLVPTVLGASSYPQGLVLDSRVYTPLTEVAPVQQEDSAGTNLQHMPVVRDFRLP